MAKKVRLTKKEVVSVLNGLELSKDFRNTGMTRQDLVLLRDSYLVKLNHECPDEASERAVIDELIGKLGGIFHKDIAQIDLRIANYPYQRSRLLVEKHKVDELQKLFDESRKTYIDKEAGNVEKSASEKYFNEQEISKESTVRDAKTESIKNNENKIEELRQRKRELESKLESAKVVDRRNFYIEKYEKEYLGTLNFFGKAAFKLKGAEERTNILEAYVQQCIAEESKIEKSEDGKISAVENPHVLCPFGEEKVYAGVKQPISYGIATMALQDEIEGIQAEIDSYAKENVEKTADNENIDKRISELEEASSECQKIIKIYNEALDAYTQNANIFASKGSAIDASLALIPNDSYDLLSARIQATEYILEHYLEEANPLERLAFTGYLKTLKEKQAFATSFKTDADPELQSIIENDLKLNLEGNNIELALEHYVLASLGRNRNVEERKKAINKYFGKYVAGLEEKIKTIEIRYTIAANTFDYFAVANLEPEYKGVNNYQAQSSAVENAVESNIKILEDRTKKLAKQKTLTGEINLQPNDQLQVYVNNPTTARYIALTMEREKLVAKAKTGKSLTEDEKRYLACLSYKITEIIETAKANGSILDISDASQVAVECLIEENIPGYDKVLEFAKLNGLKLTNSADRDQLSAKQQEFSESVVISNMDEEDIQRYANFLGIDISTFDARQKFISDYRTNIANLAIGKNITIHPSIETFRDDLITEESRNKLAGDPKKIADIFNAYGKNISVKYNEDGKLFIATKQWSETGKKYKIGEYVETTADKLLNYDLLISTGMVLDLPAEKKNKYKGIVEAIPEISKVIEERQKYVYVKDEQNNDLGLLGEASSYTSMTGEYDFEQAKIELDKKFSDGTLLKDVQKTLKANGVPLTAATVNMALYDAYTNGYREILKAYKSSKEVEVIKNSLEESVGNPVSTRPDGHIERASQYDEEITEKETKIGTYGGGRRGKIVDEVVKKMEAITDARVSFEDADSEAMEIFDQALATAVVDMLGTLDSIKVSDATRTQSENIAILNSVIQKKLNERKVSEGLTYTTSDYAIELNEEGRYNVTVGSNIYSITEDRKVSIEQREATQTVAENPTV